MEEEEKYSRGDLADAVDEKIAAHFNWYLENESKETEKPKDEKIN